MSKRKGLPAKRLEIRFRGSVLDKKRLSALARAEELTESEVMRRLISESVRAHGETDPKGPWKDLLPS